MECLTENAIIGAITDEEWDARFENADRKRIFSLCQMSVDIAACRHNQENGAPIYTAPPQSDVIALELERHRRLKARA